MKTLLRALITAALLLGSLQAIAQQKPSPSKRSPTQSTSRPTPMVAFAGARLTVCKLAVVTVRVVDPVILPKAAWIVVAPPLLPAAVEPLMVATAVSDEVQRR
jgi:hypothetical protein